jgi:hypothetical protein
MKKFLLLGIVALTMIFVSCATITSRKAQLSDVNGNSIKTGVATGKVWLGIFGDKISPTAEEAAKNGGITKIATIERSIKPGILMLWIDYTTTVTGE